MARDPKPAVQFAPKSVPLTVFLCSTPLDLAKEREYVLREIESVNGGFPRIKLHNENEIRTNSDWKSNLQQSDLLLLAVGSSYGDLMPGHDISFAEAQYRGGCKYGKPCLIYFRKSDFLTLRRYSHGHSTERLLLQEWKNTLEEKRQVRYFETADHLLIASDLRYILRALEQRWQLNREFVIAEAIGALCRGSHLPSMEIGGLCRSWVTLAIIDAVKTAKLSHTEAAKILGVHPNDLHRLIENPDIEVTQAVQADAYFDLERSYDLTLEMFGEAMEWGLGQPRGHRKRVTALAIAICLAMELPQSQVRSIARGAFMSDIGKLAIPGEIWCKVEPTEEERAMVRRYPLLGYELLKKVPFLQEAAEVAYAIEEHYDGSGYPRGLTGKFIPVGARIVSVAQSFESGISDRQQSLAEQIASARRSIERSAGKRFDPQIVKAFMSVPERIWAELVEEIDKSIFPPVR